MENLSVGMQVETKFGRGEIVAINRSSATVDVERKLGFSRLSILCKDLTPIEGQKVAVSKSKITLKKVLLKPDLNQVNELRTLQALRFGLVPHEMLPELTCGFQKIEKWVLKYLPGDHHEQSKILEICGQYGTGKSHMMSVVRHIAKREGYVTARVEVDGKTVSLSDPKILLSNLWQSLDAKGLNSATPLLDIYCRAIERGFPSPHFAPRGTDRIYHNYHTIELLKNKGLLGQYEVEYDAVLSCHDEITATKLHHMVCKEPHINCYYDKPKVLTMVGRAVLDRPYDFVKALFGNGYICYLAGYKGLVVTIDEFEVEHFGHKQWERVQDLISVLQKYIAGETDHKLAPVSLFFATVNADGPLGGDEVVDALVEVANGDCYQLDEMAWQDIEKLGKLISSLYYQVYKISDEKIAPDCRTIWDRYAQISSGKVRSFIKHYMASLDAIFGPPYSN